jgi:hypothetical protein
MVISGYCIISYCWLLYVILRLLVIIVFVATLALGLRPKLGLTKVQAKKVAQESHFLLLGMQRVWGNEPSHSQRNSHFVTLSQVSSQAQGWALVSRMRKWGDLKARSQHSALEGVEGACWACEIRLGRGQAIHSLVSCTKPTTNGLVHLREHTWCWDKPRATQPHWTHHGPDSGEATTFPHIVYSMLLHEGYIRMAFCPRTPKVESRNCPGLDSWDFGRS